MKVLLCFGAFKGTMRPLEACGAVAEALRLAAPDIEVEVCPLADGGTGTVEAIIASVGGEQRSCRVTGPLGEPVEATWGLLADGQTAVVESAAACGLALVPPDRRNPMETTTFGVGEFIALAVGAGARRILLGLGDTATVDGGLGAAQALGAKFFDKTQAEIVKPMTGGVLLEVARFDGSVLQQSLAGVQIEALCDVLNPLLGPQGAAAVFGPQKGATPEMVKLLESGLRSAYHAMQVDMTDAPGAGAAGGLGAAVIGLFGGRLVPGADRVLEVSGFQARLADVDLVITGEGRVDAQTVAGKAPARAAMAARAAGVPVWGVTGAPGDEKVCAQLFDRTVTLGDGLVCPSPTEARRRLAHAVVGALRAWTAPAP